MMKRLLDALLIAAACVLTACTTIRELPMEQRKGEPQGADHEACRTLLKAFVRNDAKAFLNCLPEEMREKFSEKQFAASRKSIIDSMGEPISFQYVTALELTTFTPHIWKIRFERKDKKGNIIHSEALFRIITGDVGQGKAAVIGFNFL